MNHNLTITLTSDEMRSLSDTAAKRGYLPVAYLKHLATQNQTVYWKANNNLNVHKPNKDGNCINCTDPWDIVKHPCKYSESDVND